MVVDAIVAAVAIRDKAAQTNMNIALGSIAIVGSLLVFVLILLWRLRRGSSSQLAAAKTLAAERAASFAKVVDELTRANADLQKKIVDLEQTGSAGMAKDASTAGDQSSGQRYRRLRALILRELHPDHAPAGTIDWALRGELFKAIWPKVEEIDRAA
jgi:hypothetical protein